MSKSVCFTLQMGDETVTSEVGTAGGAQSAVASLAPASPATGLGHLLRLLRDGRPRTRSELAAVTGLARSTVAQRVDALLASGLLKPVGEAASTGGRPPARFAFNPEAGITLAADLGATHARLAITDLGGSVLAETRADLDIALGPQHVLAWVAEHGRDLIGDTATANPRLLGIGVGLPGPVEHETGRAVNPPIMPGWDGFDVRGHLSAEFDAPVLVDNDVNIMALGEHFTAWRDVSHLMFVKAATGIGCGIISEGRLQRGAQGAAGDIGHIHLPHGREVPCRCGNTGCLEAIASGAAMVATLRAAGVDVHTSSDVVALARGGSAQVLELMRQAGRDIGEVLAAAVNLLNPSVIVLGGSLSMGGEHLIAGVREVVYRRSLPLATQHLRIAASRTGERAGVIGAAVMVIEHCLAPDRVDTSAAS